MEPKVGRQLLPHWTGEHFLTRLGSRQRRRRRHRWLRCLPMVCVAANHTDVNG